MVFDPNNLDNILNDAADATDKKYATQIEQKTTLSNDIIAAVCPEKGDTAKLNELIDIVQSAENTNNKINSIFSNSEKFGKIVVSLVSKLL